MRGTNHPGIKNLGRKDTVFLAMRRHVDDSQAPRATMLPIGLALASQACDSQHDHLANTQARVLRNPRWPNGRLPPFDAAKQRDRQVRSTDHLTWMLAT
jgi:hypothetical protein